MVVLTQGLVKHRLLLTLFVVPFTDGVLSMRLTAQHSKWIAIILLILGGMANSFVVSCKQDPSEPDNPLTTDSLMKWKWEVGDTTRWSHTMSDGNPGPMFLQTVLEKDTIDGGVRLKWEYSGTGSFWTDDLRGELCRRTFTSARTVLVKFPSVRDEILEIDSFGTSDLKLLWLGDILTYRTGATDTTINVPAGSFRCVEVRWAGEINGVVLGTVDGSSLQDLG